MREKAENEARVGTPGILGQISREILSDCTFAEDPAKVAATSAVTLYHIDSELGLYVFAQAVQAVKP